MGNSKSNEKSNQKKNGNIMDNRGYTQNIPPLNSRSNSPTQNASNQNNGRTTPTLNTNNTGNNSAQSPKTPTEANLLMKQALRNSLLSPTESNTTKSNGMFDVSFSNRKTLDLLEETDLIVFHRQ
jgi:hypothetical protein